MKNDLHVGVSEKTIRSYFDDELYSFIKDEKNYVLSSHRENDKGDRVFFQFSNKGLEQIYFVYYWSWVKDIDSFYESLHLY